MISKAKQSKEENIVMDNASSHNSVTAKGAENLKKHFGKLKEGIDGLSFQKKVRSEWK